MVGLCEGVTEKELEALRLKVRLPGLLLSKATGGAGGTKRGAIEPKNTRKYLIAVQGTDSICTLSVVLGAHSKYGVPFLTDNSTGRTRCQGEL